MALVRSLPPNSFNSQKPSEKRERGHSPHYLAAEREELFVGDSGLYCPLGVELTEGMAAEVSKQASRLVSTCCCYMSVWIPQTSSRRCPRRRLHPGGSSASSSPGSAFNEDGKTNAKEYSKKSASPDETELQYLFQKLSNHSLELLHATKDTDSLSSCTSGHYFNSNRLSLSPSWLFAAMI